MRYNIINNLLTNMNLERLIEILISYSYMNRKVNIFINEALRRLLKSSFKVS